GPVARRAGGARRPQDLRQEAAQTVGDRLTGPFECDTPRPRSRTMNRRFLPLLGPLVALSFAVARAPDQSCFALAAPPTGQADPDSDGDGLSDFHEVHKYRTDPNKKDTAGKGAPDGGWQQRREFTYSVRALVRVLPPYNLKALNDDYQDVRVLAETKK